VCDTVRGFFSHGWTKLLLGRIDAAIEHADARRGFIGCKARDRAGQHCFLRCWNIRSFKSAGCNRNSNKPVLPAALSAPTML